METRRKEVSEVSDWYGAGREKEMQACWELRTMVGAGPAELRTRAACKNQRQALQVSVLSIRSNLLALLLRSEPKLELEASEVKSACKDEEGSRDDKSCLHQ